MFDRASLIWSYMFSPKYECRYVCQQFINGRWKSVSIAQFSKSKDNIFWMSGAVPRELYNSGIGIYTAVAYLEKFFKTHPNAVVKSGAFLNNTRSFRMTQSIGFKLERQDDNHFESYITKEQFNNDFANRIKKRINL
jgi:hypothetical protein